MKISAATRMSGEHNQNRAVFRVRMASETFGASDLESLDPQCLPGVRAKDGFCHALESA